MDNENVLKLMGDHLISPILLSEPTRTDGFVQSWWCTPAIIVFVIAVYALDNQVVKKREMKLYSRLWGTGSIN